ncbi:ABC transporter ATP-binding protein [Mycetocola zhadangensis]|uniref:ABC transporter ATP-binding protein n=1 Tax=Mycetocola zhadangensis TaxID=1164595 RepID=A0A3L7J1Z0_9MICO|nr:ABC transporter ATP-binding protein [Mycetocola zhadangensis]RLQ84429.1 ABC transporter ATP-binding protein [Mycetocola zhadangensis]GGE93101.1 ABC transporter [Mycetocola zhadangensis]
MTSSRLTAGPQGALRAVSNSAKGPEFETTDAALTVSFAGIGRTFPGERGQGRSVLRDISLDVKAGEVLAILGTSGCGKSTLLRIAGGLDSATTGDILIDGRPVTPFDARTAVGFQEPRLLPWRSVADNVALGLVRGTPKTEGAARVANLIDLVGLGAFAGHRPRQISGGMAQRASLARALARNPGVLLLDEPFGALDALTRLKMQDLLLDVHAAAPTTVLLVTHDVDEALQLADRIILLGRKDGEEGSSIAQEIVVPGHRPRDRGSAELAELRGRLLAGLGIDRHGEARGVEKTTAMPTFPY